MAMQLGKHLKVGFGIGLVLISRIANLVGWWRGVVPSAQCEGKCRGFRGCVVRCRARSGSLASKIAASTPHPPKKLGNDGVLHEGPACLCLCVCLQLTSQSHHSTKLKIISIKKTINLEIVP